MFRPVKDGSTNVDGIRSRTPHPRVLSDPISGLDISKPSSSFVVTSGEIVHDTWECESPIRFANGVSHTQSLYEIVSAAERVRRIHVYRDPRVESLVADDVF